MITYQRGRAFESWPRGVPCAFWPRPRAVSGAATARWRPVRHWDNDPSSPGPPATATYVPST